jgi:hypothetical protein
MLEQEIRYYVVLGADASAKVYPDYVAGDTEAVGKYIRSQLGKPLEDIHLSVSDLPSNNVHTGEAADGSELKSSSAVVDKENAQQELVVSLTIQGERETQRIDRAVATQRHKSFAGGGPDLPFAAADHWCPREATDPIFSRRAEAERQIGITFLRAQNGTSGSGVNVVIADQGLNAVALGHSYGGGWRIGSKLPGTTKPLEFPVFGAPNGRHGMMIARNILKTAPDVTFFDLPIAPWDIDDIPAFLSLAQVAFQRMLSDIGLWRMGARPGPWVLVNPWGIFDTSSEVPPGSYTNNPHNPFNQLIADIVKDDIDVVFSAGNCGQFCPDWRCAPNVIGPGGSILGANSHEDVLTVGAVRADGMWLGYSAQGPGQPRMDRKKPDLCASSQFREDDNAFAINTGTSAACGMAAGVVAALRSNWNAARVPPLRLKKVLNDTARKPPGLGWGNILGERLGNGILDAEAAFKELARHYP